MSVAVNAFCQQRAAAKSAGITIIRNIFKTQQFPEGLSTKQLYKLALKEPAPANFQPYPLAPPPPKPTSTSKKNRYAPEVKDVYPPNPAHPIRSLSFLKSEILAALKAQNEIRTVRQAKAAAKLAEEAALASAATKKERKKLAASQMEFVWMALPPRKAPAPPPVKEVIGREVGVGADISHLNKRRQRARVAKVGRSVLKMKAIQQGLKPRPLAGRPNYRANSLATEAEAAAL